MPPLLKGLMRPGLLCCAAVPLLAAWIAREGYSAYRFVYLHGPAMMGGWEGQPIEEICARLTQTSSLLWQEGASTREDCVAIIDRKVTSHLVGSLTVVAVATAYHVFQCLSYLVFWSACARIREEAPPPPRRLAAAIPLSGDAFVETGQRDKSRATW